MGPVKGGGWVDTMVVIPFDEPTPSVIPLAVVALDTRRDDETLWSNVL
jgi:hypothetical protein